MKKNNGITLISLVVTIVVLLILAGISLNLVMGNNGIVERAKDAKAKTEKAEFEEKVDLANLSYSANYSTDRNNAYDLLIKELEQYNYSYEPGEKILTVYSKPDKTGYEKEIELKEATLEQIIDINPGDITKNPTTGEDLTGTEDNPYLIGSIEDLVGFAYKVNTEGVKYTDQYINLNSTLSFNNRNSYVNPDRTSLVVDGITQWGGETQVNTLMQTMRAENNEKGWTPIGTNSYYDQTKARNFQGIFNGNDNSILDMYIKNCENEDIAFFGVLDEAIVKNLNIQGNIYIDGNVTEDTAKFVGRNCRIFCWWNDGKL